MHPFQLLKDHVEYSNMSWTDPLKLLPLYPFHLMSFAMTAITQIIRVAYYVFFENQTGFHYIVTLDYIIRQSIIK